MRQRMRRGERHGLAEQAAAAKRSSATTHGVGAQVIAARRPVEQMPGCEAVLYATDLASNCNVCPKCGHHKRLEARARASICCSTARDVARSAARSCRSIRSLQGQPPLSGAPAGSPPRHRRDRGAGGGAGLDQDPAGRPGRFRVRLHGRFDGLGAGRALRAWRAGGGRAGLPFICVTASGGARMQEGLFFADADGQDDGHIDLPFASPAAVHLDSHRSDDGRRVGILRLSSAMW
jgi:hypothetical protein